MSGAPSDASPIRDSQPAEGDGGLLLYGAHECLHRMGVFQAFFSMGRVHLYLLCSSFLSLRRVHLSSAFQAFFGFRAFFPCDTFIFPLRFRRFLVFELFFIATRSSFLCVSGDFWFSSFFSLRHVHLSFAFPGICCVQADFRASGLPTFFPGTSMPLLGLCRFPPGVSF